MRVDKNDEAGQAFSSIDFVGDCLVDVERTKFFQKIITRYIKKNHIVVDLGSGSGILALFAASFAKKVYAVEFDPYVAKIALGNFKLNNTKNISLIKSDARNVSFGKVKKFNIVLAEMLTTGMVDENQVQAINNLHNKGIVDQTTKFIPERQQTYVSLANANLNFFGKKISMILHLWKWHDWKDMRIKKLSAVKLINDIDFRVKNKELVDVKIKFDVTKESVVNGVYMNSRSVFDNRNFLGDTEALNAPIFIPVKPLKVKKGDVIKGRIKYTFGGGYEGFQVSLVK